MLKSVETKNCKALKPILAQCSISILPENAGKPKVETEHWTKKG